MTVPFGPFRVVLTISRRSREGLHVPRSHGATDSELARLVTSRRLEADLIRWQADQMMFGSRLV